MNNNIPVFFHCSDEFCPFLSVTMASILYNTESFIDFYVIETGISNFHKKQVELLKERFNNFSIEWIHFEYNDVFKKEYFEKLKPYTQEWQWPGVHGFATPFMPLVKPNIDKFIYLDSDLVFLDDIKLLFDVNVENVALAAVPELVIPLYVGELIQKINKNIPYEEYGKYFNAGLMVINSKYMREQNMIEKYFELASTEVMQIADQDILNRMYGNNFLPLDVKYNFIYMPDREQLKRKNINKDYEYFEQQKKEMVVRHYADKKPWLEYAENWTYKSILNFQDFWFFAKMTPFYDGISKNFFASNIDIKYSDLYKKNKLDLLELDKDISDKLARLDKKEVNKVCYLYSLFNFIPIIKINKEANIKKYYLFGVIPLFKIKGVKS